MEQDHWMTLYGHLASGTADGYMGQSNKSGRLQFVHYTGALGDYLHGFNGEKRCSMYNCARCRDETGRERNEK